MIRMPCIAKKVELTDGMRNIFQKIANSRTRPLNQIQRSKIILLASEGKSNSEIEKIVGIKHDAVSKWRCRFINEREYLLKAEESKPEDLEESLIKFLRDKPRQGAPCNFTEEQIIKILEIACRNPLEFGYEASHWSTPMLAKAVVREKIAENISASSINRFLKYGGNKTA